MSYIIEDAVVKMIRDRSFYAYLVQNCVLHVTMDVPTAGVNVNRGKLNLYINPLFWQAVKEDFGVTGQAKILEHEMMHIALGHLFRKVEQENGTNDAILTHSAVNITMDVAINQYLDSLPTNFRSFDKQGKPILDDSGNIVLGNPVTFENFKESLEKNGINTNDLERKREFEHYYSFLKNNMDKLPTDSSGMMSGFGDTIDDHDIMNQGDKDKDLVKNACKSAMSKALESAKAAGVDNLHQIEELINTVYKTEVNWKVILSQFLGNACDVLKEQTRKRRNRRYGIYQPGERVFPKLNLFIGIDTSGSIGLKEKNIFFKQINSIVDDRFDITLGDCDTELQNIRKYNRVIPNPKLSGGGGTAYAPFFEYAKRNKVDAMIILGDGYCFDINKLEKPNNIPVLWAIIENGKFPVEWGYKLTINLPKSE